MNGTTSKRELKSSFRASPSSIRPLYTGGPVLLTRDGEWLITTMGEEVVVTEVRTGLGVARVKGDTTPITALALSYHTSPPTLVTCHQSNTIRYYPLPEALPTTPKPPFLQYTRALPRASGAPILVAAVSPDATLLATGSSDGIVKVWDLAGGYVTHMFRGHGGPVSALAFSFPSTGEERQRMELWTGSTDTKVRVFDLRDAGARVVVAGGSGAAKPKAVLEGHVSVVRGIAVTEDGRFAITGGRDKVVLVWDLGDQKEASSKGKGAGPKIVQTLLANEQVEACGLLPRDQAVVGGSTGRLLCYTAGDAGTVKVWDVLKAAEVATMKGVEGVDEDDDEDEQRGVIAVLYDATTASLVSVHADQNIIFHSLATFSTTRQIVGFNDDIVDTVFLSSNGQESTHVALATNSSLVRIYSTSAFDARLLSGHRDMVLCLDKSADGRWLVTGSKDRTARVWVPSSSSSGWKCIAVCEGHTEAIGAVALSRKADDSGRFLFTASQDRTIKMWDLTALSVDDGDDDEEPFKARSLATLRIADKDINSLDIAPNDRFLVSGSQDKLVKVFEIDFTPSSAGASGGVKHIGTCKGHRRGVWAVKFSRNDRIVASGAADRTIKLWSLDDFACLKTFEGHTNSVLRVDFLTSGAQLVSSASDGLVKLWNIRDEECVATLDNHEDKVWALAVSPDERTLVSAGADSVATFWEDSTEVEQAEKNAALVAAVQSEQDFNNYLSLKDYRRAIGLALAMSQPGRLLSLFRTVLASASPADVDIDGEDTGAATGSAEVDEVIRTLRPLDLVRLLKHVRDWNANAKTSFVAQGVLNAIFRLRSPEDILQAFETTTKPEVEEEDDDDDDESDDEAAAEAKKKAAKAIAPTISMRELLDGLIPYSERHLARVDRLVQESYMLDYTISEMDGGVFGTELIEVD
ncbi:U3 small nucleolar RNA-associated protein 13 [Vanrija albida]|uniref:U3 small nucleolar RNA-associated protein 13 n=1 Tax=Vanrija albida TaxID=181172 RepID=A0ABR3Q8X9_9TREE